MVLTFHCVRNLSTLDAIGSATLSVNLSFAKREDACRNERPVQYPAHNILIYSCDEILAT